MSCRTVWHYKSLGVKQWLKWSFLDYILALGPQHFASVPTANARVPCLDLSQHSEIQNSPHSQRVSDS